MTGERLCIHCWHRESDRVIIHDEEQGDVEYCEPCGAGHGVHPFEAAPSTDEGEARWERYVTTDKGTLWRSGATLAANVPAGVEAAIRAPLEERIRGLQRWAEIDHANLEAVEAEVERLREALDAIGWHVSPESPIGRIVHGALATPPSSTEGTKEGGE